jgi:hypothetical protein
MFPICVDTAWSMSTYVKDPSMQTERIHLARTNGLTFVWDEGGKGEEEVIFV